MHQSPNSLVSWVWIKPWSTSAPLSFWSCSSPSSPSLMQIQPHPTKSKPVLLQMCPQATNCSTSRTPHHFPWTKKSMTRRRRGGGGGRRQPRASEQGLSQPCSPRVLSLLLARLRATTITPTPSPSTATSPPRNPRQPCLQRRSWRWLLTLVFHYPLCAFFESFLMIFLAVFLIFFEATDKKSGSEFVNKVQFCWSL